MNAFDSPTVVLCVSSDVPCETTIPYPCIDLLQWGFVSNTDSVRDEVDGNCILCIPPNSTWNNAPSSLVVCPTCRCEAGQIDCFDPPIIGLAIFADETTAPCPTSQYEGWLANAVFATSNESPCPSPWQIEEALDCPNSLLENQEESSITIASSTASISWPSNRPTRTPSLHPAVARSEPISSSEESPGPVTSAASSFYRCLLGLLLYVWLIPFKFGI